ncbi:MAG TPA: hypothetical protein VJC37_02650 [Planctomycetota bacterium]|nr:hypothetical protein [Planctomycetota bacterium]
MKTLLIMVLILLALVGIMSVVIYASNPKANAGRTIKNTSLLPRESTENKGTVQFTPITQVESDNLALIEDQSLLGLTAGAFNPWFTPLSASEQNTLKTSEQQNPELQNMTAGNLDDNAGFGWSVVFLVIIGVFLGIPF